MYWYFSQTYEKLQSTGNTILEYFSVSAITGTIKIAKQVQPILFAFIGVETGF